MDEREKKDKIMKMGEKSSKPWNERMGNEEREKERERERERE